MTTHMPAGGSIPPSKKASDAARSRSFAMIPRDVLEDCQLTVVDRAVYGVIALHLYDGVARLSLGRIGKFIGRRRDAVRKALRNLIRVGYVMELPTKNGAHYKLYRLTHSVHATGHQQTHSVSTAAPLAPTKRVMPETSSAGATHTKHVLDLITKGVEENNGRGELTRPDFAKSFEAMMNHARRARAQDSNPEAATENLRCGGG